MLSTQLFRAYQLSKPNIEALREIALRLRPYKSAIINKWLEKHLTYEPSTWVPKNQLAKIYRDLVNKMFDYLRNGNPYEFLVYLSNVGHNLADSGFPFDSLIITLHFFEESYLPHLADEFPEDPIKWITAFDVFLHLCLASFAYSYFERFRKAMLDEVEIGKTIQLSVLPQKPPRTEKLDFGVLYASATLKAYIGGDLYDLFELGKERIGLAVADVSGKGIQAATKMTMVRFMLRGFATENSSLSEKIVRLNKALNQNLEKNDFVTLFFGVLNLTENKIHYVNAGHPSPILSSRGSIKEIITETNLPLGPFPEARYQEQVAEFESGDILVAYTDGLTEARRNHEFFSEKRVMKIIKKNSHLPAQQLCNKIYADCLAFTQGKLQDDLAIVIVKRI
jgi:sigma-B regulation protein RsbU (phosphoserine phosphatase)